MTKEALKNLLARHSKEIAEDAEEKKRKLKLKKREPEKKEKPTTVYQTKYLSIYLPI